MLLPPHPHHRHPRPHTRQHYWFYYALSPLHSALIHHRLAMLLPPHSHPHHHHALPYTSRHHWFPDQTIRVQSWPVVAGWWRGGHRAHRFCHHHLLNPRCPLASRNAVRHPYNHCLSGCLGQCFRSQVRQAPLQTSNSQEQ